MEIRLASPIQIDSIVDGPGIRAVIWTQGCPHKCAGCHNPITHSIHGGYLEDIQVLKDELSTMTGQSGVTFSGGDPIVQSEACSILAKHCKSLGLDIWLYTGYTYEQLQKMATSKKSIMDLLQEIDVLVDGKFVLAEKSLNLKFKGSHNQRVIDMKKTLLQKAIVLYEEENDETFANENSRKGIYI